MRMSDEEAAQILTVGAGRRLRPRPRRRAARECERLRDAPRRPAGGPPAAGLHARVVDGAALGLLLAAGLPGRLGARAGGDDLPVPAAGGRALRRGPADEDPRAGGLGAVVPRGGGAARRCRSGCGRTAPEGVGQSAATLVETERVLASVIEAVIGAVYLDNGYDRTAEAVVEAFMPEIERGAGAPGGLQVDAAGAPGAARARRWPTRWSAELGPPHDRTFEVVGARRGRGGGPRARGARRSTPSRRPRRRRWRRSRGRADDAEPTRRGGRG